MPRCSVCIRRALYFNEQLRLAHGRGETASSPTKRTEVCERIVRFTEDTKTHDGLCPKFATFAEYMRDVYREVVRPNGDTTVSIIAHRLDIPGLMGLRVLLVDLMDRCTSSQTGHASVLPGGAGCNSAIINHAHLPYLQTHAEYLDTVIAKVQALIDHTKKDEVDTGVVKRAGIVLCEY